MRYGLRRMTAIRGGSDLNGQAVNGDGDRRRLLLRAIAVHSSVPPCVGSSAGGTCVLCREAIAAGARQYEIEVGQSTIVVDENCYKSSLQDILEAKPIVES
jgi:hypothetical protein